MDFLEVIEQAKAVLQSKGRVAYRTLKRQFGLDDEALEDLKLELIEVEELAIDKDGKMLVWVGEHGAGSTEQRAKSEGSPESRVQSPESKTSGLPDAGLRRSDPGQWTPSHLAERIRAVTVTDGERKTITALFADLKGSTALIEGLDPEEARTVIDPALQLMMDAVHQYDGFVAQALGDGIFALFGAPIAHEDHPQRAVYAALRMQEAMRGYADTLRAKGHPPLLMRVGLNTGEVVVRSIRKDDLHADYVPVGHATNLAARMEQLAAPGSIVVTAYTQKLTEGYFAFKDLGPTQIKGVEEPLNVYEVLGAGPLRTRLQVSASRYGLTRFVGRQSELDQMRLALGQVKEGHGQIVGVMGEPGLGKSRLFYEFKLTSQSGCLVLEAFSVSHGKASPYLPLIELLKDYFEIDPSDDERKRREKVNGKVITLDRSLEATLPYLFSLLGIATPDSSLTQMDAQIRRQRTFEALKKLFLRESLNQPLILLFEDLHWIDTETQGFLDMLSESIGSAPLLLLVNYRPEYRHEWGSKTYYTQLRLAPLGRAEAEELLIFLLGSDTSLAPLTPLILERTEGTPFFMEEVVQTLVEEGVLVGERGHYRVEQTPTELHISPTVQGVLAARIDRLTPEEKALLQQLSVIGRQFPVSLIKQVISKPETEWHRVLASLQAKEFLYEQPAFPEVEYFFKHALTQEVAYGTVLQEQRKALHERTGQALETVYAATLSEHYGDLAYHYCRSPNTEKAIHYLHLAGQQDAQRSANSEAISHFTAALKLLLMRPETPARVAQELTLRLAVGPLLMATQGWTAPAVEQHYLRARVLCAQLGDSPQRVPMLFGLWLFHLIRGDLRTAQALAEECLQLAEQIHEDGLLLEAHFAAGDTFLWRGELVPARRSLEQSLRLYQPQHQALTSLYGGINPKIASLCNMFLVLWMLGYPEQARTRAHEALQLVKELGHPQSFVHALVWSAHLQAECGDGRCIQECTDATVALASEHGFPFYLAWGTVYRGAALIVQGQRREGVDQVRQGLEAYAGEVVRTAFLTWLASGYRGTGQVEEALATITEALGLVEKNDERFYEAEVWRIKGSLTLQLKVESEKSKVEEAEECFLKAIEITQKQHAKSLELRAAMSLARLWQTQGKIVEAHRMLSDVYNWFTEGFDTKDLQEAKTLLEELSQEGKNEWIS